MDDDMFSMLDKTKKVKKSKARPAQNGSKAPAGKRRTRSGSSESDNKVASGEDGPSERKKVRTELDAEVDPMEALESNGGDKMISYQTMDVGDASVDMGVLSEASKPMPVVTDDFEQEAEREVAATSGFASVDEGEKMRLVHQVRHQVSLPPLGGRDVKLPRKPAHTMLFPYRSPCPQIIPTSPSLPMCRKILLQEATNSLSIPSSG
jgi:hypothetical protein